MPDSKRKNIGRFIIIPTLVCLILMLINPECVIDSVKNSLYVCAVSIIPSLFPFSVISEILVACGAGEAAGAVFSGPMHMLFGISGAGSCSVFLGSVCGVPIGARTSVSMYDKGILSKSEVEHLITFSNNPSAAFLIGGVGITMLGSRTAGIVIYVSSLISATLTGIAGRYILRPESSGRIGNPHPYPYAKTSKMLTDAIATASSSVISVCGCTVFFSALIASLTSLPLTDGMSPLSHSLVHGLFEMSGGMSLASKLSGRILPATACALICGWSGLSVHMQVVSVCGCRGLSLKPYFVSKTAQSLMTASLTAAIFALFPKITLPDSRDVINLISSEMPAFMPIASVILMFIGTFIWVIGKVKNITA